MLSAAVKWQVIFSNPCGRVALPKNKRQEAAYLRGCEQLLAKMCGELAALCNMDSNPAPGEKSIERLTAHGLTAPENLKDYCRCSPVDAQVMDFHIGNLLDAYDFLTAFHHV